MSTRTSVHTATENTVTFVQNQMFTGFVTIANEADVSNQWLIDNRDHLEKALSTWLSEQSLSKIKLEICDSNHNVMDAYVFDVSYEGDMGYVKFPVEEICESIDSYRHIDGAHIHINPTIYSSKISEDFGYNFSDEGSYTTSSLSFFGTGRINVEVGKIVSHGSSVGQKADNRKTSIISSIALLCVFGAVNAGLFVLFTGLMGLSYETLSFIFGSHTLIDSLELFGLLSIPFVFFMWYTDTFDRIGIFAVIPAITFLVIVNVIFPMSYINPFSLSDLPMWLALILVSLIFIAEFWSSVE